MREDTPKSAAPLAQGLLAGLAAVLTVLAALAVFRPGSAPPRPAGPGQADGVAPIPASAVLHPEIHSVTAAAPAGRGWVLLDPRKGRIHRVDARGRSVLEFGRPGRGPGELSSPADLLVRGDTVLVAERSGERLHRFTLGGGYLGSRSVVPPGCPGGGLTSMESMGAETLLLFRCLDPARTGSRTAVYALDDPLRLLVSRPLHGTGTGLSPFLMPVLAAHARGFYLGVTTETCLEAFDREGRGRVQGPVCHPWSKPVPLPAQERARLEVVRRRLGKGPGSRLEIPSVLPAFDRVFTPGDRPVFLTVTGVEGRALDVLEGDSLRRLRFPATPGTFVGDRSILVTWQQLDGTWVRVYPLRS